PNAVASVAPGRAGTMPDFLGSAGDAALTGDWRGIITFSGKHWDTGDHIAVTTVSRQAVDPAASLVWTELDSGASGTIARDGDPAGAAAPDLAHDGSRVVYTSTDAN